MDVEWEPEIIKPLVDLDRLMMWGLPVNLTPASMRTLFDSLVNRLPMLFG